ncbi:MAG: hypothetical protein EBU90_10870 [Proteobacteria bacterium]|nr:hypothetical protein [Pseudomonadota bacterium]NBP14728.1 hypothetical protein [bacterium]
MFKKFALVVLLITPQCLVPSYHDGYQVVPTAPQATNFQPRASDTDETGYPVVPDTDKWRYSQTDPDDGMVEATQPEAEVAETGTEQLEGDNSDFAVVPQ